MHALKRLLVAIRTVLIWTIGLGASGFVLGWVIAGEDRHNIHGGFVLVFVLTLFLSLLGFFVGLFKAATRDIHQFPPPLDDPPQTGNAKQSEKKRE